MTTGTPEFQQLPLAKLQLSKTHAQVERRKHFDKHTLEELAESIRTIGVLQPIVARRAKVIRTPGLNGVTVAGKTYFSPDEAEDAARNTFEVVAGERRILAAKQAGLETVPVTVRELSDEQVIEVQLIENLQREGLHELIEAEGYEALMKPPLRYTVTDIAEKVGKSVAYVYARLKLTALCPEARKAFYAGDLDASRALLLARIPVHDLQRKALKEITKPQWGPPMAFRQAREHVQQNYMLRLDQAPFPTGDADLVLKAGPCGACPKRTGNQPELFGDVKSADVCTDPVCFAAKRDANLVRLAAAAEASGKDVITGAEAKKIAPHGVDYSSDLKGYIKLGDRCYGDRKNRRYDQLIGKDVEVKHLQDVETGKLVPIAREADVKAALKKAGIRSGHATDEYRAKQSATDRKRKLEIQFRRRLLEEIRPKLARKLGRPELEQIAAAFWRRRENESQKQVLKLWNLEPAKRQYGHDVEKPMLERIPKMTDAELALFMQDLVFVSDLQVWTFSNEGPRSLLAAAKRVHVNPDKLKRVLTAAAKAKKNPAAKKAAKAK